MKHWETESGKLAIAAYRYLLAAETIFVSTERPRLMFAPVLHLAAHGCEVLLKSVLCLQGETARTTQVAYGHKINDMWIDPRCSTVRQMAREFAMHADHAAGGHIAGPAIAQPQEMLDRVISDLSDLHSQQPLPLRYMHDETQEAPPPHLLIFSLLPVAHSALHNPTSLIPA